MNSWTCTELYSYRENKKLLQSNIIYYFKPELMGEPRKIIHMVGGIAALVGAIFLGPRIGKYIKNDEGKVIKVNAIPGHSIPLGALGAFILWFGWYGFNGAAATGASE